MIDNSEVINSFLEETSDLLQKWEKECLALEKNLNKEDYNEIFRIAHNIKGSAKMFGLDSFAHFVHLLEDVINLLRERKLKLSIEIIELFLDGHSLLVSWVAELRLDISYIPELKGEIGRIEKLILSTGQKLNASSNINLNLNDEKVVQELNDQVFKQQLEQDVQIAQTEVVCSTTPSPKVAISVTVDEVEFCDDLIISNLANYIQKYKFEEGKNYSIDVKSNQIDTAGIQYLLSLLKTNNMLVKIKCENKKVLDTFKLLGVTRFIV
ncbi:MAG: Hpt domain-containing protein [Oligoflexia bacterium]|nr:Hpt domain-containing protein [Oligoflexia bacterium]